MRTAKIFALARMTALVCAAAMLAACNSTTPTKKTPVRIDIVDAVGFTIVEDASIDGDVRLDYDRALALLEQGSIQAGIDILETVIVAAPELSAPRIDLAIAYHRLDDLEATERHLLAALEINPQHPIALNELGIVYRKTARFAEARASYEAALAVYPGFHYARRNLAVLCDLYMDDLGCARDNYEAYLATVHSDEEASMWLKNVRFRQGD